MSLRDLYQEIIIDHSKSPRNFGKLAQPTHQQLGHNPLCGDQLQVFVVSADDKIVDIQFSGTGCAISIASASLMTEAVKGKPLQQCTALFHGFHELVTQGKNPEISIGKLEALAGVAAFPIRVKCATLAWHTLKAALEQKPDAITTE